LKINVARIPGAGTAVDQRPRTKGFDRGSCRGELTAGADNGAASAAHRSPVPNQFSVYCQITRAGQRGGEDERAIAPDEAGVGERQDDGIIRQSLRTARSTKRETATRRTDVEGHGVCAVVGDKNGVGNGRDLVGTPIGDGTPVAARGIGPKNRRRWQSSAKNRQQNGRQKNAN